MKLLCGDRRVNCITGEIESHSNGQSLDMPKWIKERTHLKRFLDRAAMLSRKETVVFIDSNPFMTVLTEVAILSATKMIVPTLADDYSTDALRNMVYLLHGVGRSPLPAVALYEQTMFWSKARHYRQQLREVGVQPPRIHTVIFNKCKVKTPSNHEHAMVTQAQQSIFDVQCAAIWDIIQEIRAHPDVDVKDVFNFGSTNIPLDRERGAIVVGNLLGAHMTDMLSAGIICMRCGLPLWTLRRNRVAAAEEMDMTHSAISASQRTSLLQIIGRSAEGIAVELHDEDDEELNGVLHSILRGRPRIPKRRIMATLDEETWQAQKAYSSRYGPKRQRSNA